MREMVPYLEPAIALLPGQMQVSYEEGRYHMSHVVVHPAGQPQLPHGRVHQGVACSAPLPRLQVATVTAPSESLWERGQGAHTGGQPEDHTLNMISLYKR